MSTIDQTFNQLKQAGKKAFIPFVTAGDPNLEVTASVVRELAKRGCSICEIGIPYSDPIADGPIIQASYTRALDQGVELSQILDCLRGVTPGLASPVVTMVSYAIVHRVGLQNYVERAQAAGVAGTIVPDLPIDEAEKMSRVCQRMDFSLIQLVTPTTPQKRALQIAETSTGFLYYVSVTGITGERTQLPPELIDAVGWLREQVSLPICIGFGISQPEHVKLLSPVADGLIVGSALVRRIAVSHPQNVDQTIKGVGDYVTKMMAALA